MSLFELLKKPFAGVAEAMFSVIEKYFPPELTPEQKSHILLAMQKAEFQRAQAMCELIARLDRQFTRRTMELEGTAKDLKSIPLLGPLMLFLRGCQRPVWGFATLYIDGKWFAGMLPHLTQTQEHALMLINGLVLGFLFGERALKNAAPTIERIMLRRRNDTKE